MSTTDGLSLWIPNQKFVQTEKEWVESEVKDVGEETVVELSKRAAANRKNVYAPYSHYQVGVTILSTSGELYDGVNIERASYSETVHAEEVAIAKAVSEGEAIKSGRRFLKALAVSHPSDSAPCGHCRQIMVEHADNCLVIVANEAGEVRRITSLKLLLPYAFTPTDLGIE